MPPRWSGRALPGVAAALLLASCAATPNPSFPITVDQAEAELREMRRSPVPQRRPLVIVGGYGDPGFASGSIRDVMAPLFVEPRIVAVKLAGVDTFAAARARLIEAIDEAFPSSDPRWTAEVDVIGNSMGGVVAWYAADETAGPRSARVATLFTIGSPFQGAEIARTFPVSELVRDVEPGAAFLAQLDEHQRGRGPEVVPYARSDDTFVGAANAAPPGQTPWWVGGEFLNSGHLTSFDDNRILADIARRLRGETPFTTDPRAPLPAK